MPFLKGRVSYTKFRSHCGPEATDDAILDRLREFRFGTQTVVTKDRTEIGFIAGELLDVEFTREKNLIEDAFFFGVRIDQHKIPGNLLRARTAKHLAAISAGNPSGFPSRSQKQEAKEAAREECEQEIRDGKHHRRNSVPVMLDLRNNTCLIGATGSALDRTQAFLQHTFGPGICKDAVDPHELTDGHGMRPSFAHEYAWVPASDDRNFLGSEFLLWLWYQLSGESDTIDVADGTQQVTVMIANLLHLECPRGQTGKEAFRTEGPASLPEALRAIQDGKMPRKMGLMISRHGQVYELTLSDMLVVSGAKLPPTEAEDARESLVERVGQVRHLDETLRLLFERFADDRSNHQTWPGIDSKIKNWLRPLVASA